MIRSTPSSAVVATAAKNTSGISSAKTRQEADAPWVWFAIDARTKIIPVLKVGPRTQPMAHAVVHALAKVLAPDCLPIFTSDGLKLYFYALTAHFGSWAVTVGRQTHQWQVHAE